MLAATYAKQIGRGVAFSLAAFRQTFAAGRDLGSKDTVLIAGAACEMHPAALLKALERPSLTRALEAATAAARNRGVSRLPAIAVTGQVLAGADVLQQVSELLSSEARA
jgi:2-hydroxychromene-2-carboxylate isomerase